MPDRRSAASIRLPLPTAAPGFGGLALPGATATAPDARGVVAVRGSDSSSSGGGRGSTEKERKNPAGPEGGAGDRRPKSGSGESGRESGSGSEKSANPFAPPPEGQPDQPWRPRTPAGGSGDDSGQGRGGGRWSDRQPGRSPNPFGSGPGSRDDNGEGRPPGPRWDPRDPGQRRARYALLSGMWSFFFALFNWPSVALLLGALSVYWGVTSLKMRSRPADATAGAERAPGGSAPAATEAGTRQQTTAAVSGLVTAGLGLALVAAMFSARLVYSDYYTCMDDALTNATRDTCEKHLPKDLRPLLGVDNDTEG
ncbi:MULTISPECIES: hypothetical protein [Streptomyces]|uniref:Integral membrane protein n=4 Tax=Streptomyces TaxID=1883 RepID=A0A8H9HGE7_9ACTN|nr:MULTISPECIES: hypothetical protein [Streptomyces]MDQ0295223.1 hypothetical protein [Streptomyces sp. DSM 41037]QNE81436.1 hypothetical protein F0345_10195 [Streptomyces rutgersensis]WSU37541.1 hypothetical protein OG378_18010 [Streptomyces gougerotii]SUP62232.1 Integral membrane protein [Streptomyces griseus]GFH65443.1 hypothetical protein Srut_19570 [Streptomyces rutgersensis]